MGFKKSTLLQIRDALSRRRQHASAAPARTRTLPGIEVGGKTGTAQASRAGGDKSSQRRWSREKRDHAWFIAFAPVDNPEIAIAVLAEHCRRARRHRRGADRAQGAGALLRHPRRRPAALKRVAGFVPEHDRAGGSDPPLGLNEPPSPTLTRTTDRMRQFDRRLAYHFDWLLLGLTLLIIGGGLATIFSATEARVHTGFTEQPAGDAASVLRRRRVHRHDRGRARRLPPARALRLRASTPRRCCSLVAVPLRRQRRRRRAPLDRPRAGLDPAVGDDQDRAGDRAGALFPSRPGDRRRAARSMPLPAFCCWRSRPRSSWRSPISARSA